MIPSMPAVGPTYIPPAKASPWLTAILAEVPSWPAGCRHVIRGSVLIKITAIWDGAVYCPECALVSGTSPLGTVQDRTCDRCGHVCAVALGEAMNAAWSSVGDTWVYFGLCTSCYRQESP